MFDVEFGIVGEFEVEIVYLCMCGILCLDLVWLFFVDVYVEVFEYW